MLKFIICDIDWRFLWYLMKKCGRDQKIVIKGNSDHKKAPIIKSVIGIVKVDVKGKSARRPFENVAEIIKSAFSKKY